jgi:hypothetical protein
VAYEKGEKLPTNLIQIGWEIVDWIHLAQDKDAFRAILDAVMKLTKCVEFFF